MHQLDKYTFDSLDRLINYIYDQEAKHFEEASDEEKKNHIFNDIEVVSGYCDKIINQIQS